MQYRLLIFVGVVLGANLQVLDTTMATVALPRIQGTLSATLDEIAWVLASYLIAVAIVMPLVGTLTQRMGRKRVFLISVAGFCIASIFTGSADSLQEIVIYRFLQGIFASSLVPISQSFVFDAYPPEERGRAMGWWSLGIMAGMVSGPAIGGYLAEFHNWRWAFYINVPIGLIAFGLIYVFGPSRPHRPAGQPFGLVGFLLLSVGLVCTQIVLSRGERMDWFSAPQIIWATVVAVFAFYLFGVHSTYSSRPFIARRVLSDRNFMIGFVCLFLLGLQWLSFLTLISPYLQILAGYPVFLAGLVMVPQALGNAAGSVLGGQLVSRAHPLKLMVCGVLALAWANWQMSSLTPDFNRSVFYSIVFLHGFGIGIFFVPLSVVTFSTLPRQYRDVGTGLFSLARNLGSSVGVSLVIAFLVRETQVNRYILKDYASPFNEVFRHTLVPQLWDTAEKTGASLFELEVSRQAATIAYIDDFLSLAITSLIFLPILYFIRLPSRGEV
tara:strand:- start:359 stop:1849 length:1491 start_codon:yes stop_codon:yes gene_type:complete